MSDSPIPPVSRAAVEALPLRCPACGNEARLVTDEDERQYSVECSSWVKLKGGEVVACWRGPEHYTRDEALAAWNAVASRAAPSAPSAPEASPSELARLRAIEHHAWHVLDDSCESDGEVRIYTGRDYDCLLALLPEDHPQHDTEHTMNFGNALDLLKSGHRVARSGWNGKAMFLFLVPGSHFTVNRAPLLGIYPEGTEIDYQPHIDMRTAQGSVVPWLASQTDVLAEDWELVG